MPGEALLSSTRPGLSRATPGRVAAIAAMARDSGAGLRVSPHRPGLILPGYSPAGVAQARPSPVCAPARHGDAPSGRLRHLPCHAGRGPRRASGRQRNGDHVPLRPGRLRLDGAAVGGDHGRTVLQPGPGQQALRGHQRALPRARPFERTPFGRGEREARTPDRASRLHPPRVSPLGPEAAAKPLRPGAVLNETRVSPLPTEGPLGHLARNHPRRGSPHAVAPTPAAQTPVLPAPRTTRSCKTGSPARLGPIRA